MAGTAPPKLAAAVCNAGGLGSIAVGATDVDGARAQIQQTRALTDCAFNVNFFCHAPAQHDDAKQSNWLNRLRPTFDDLGVTAPDTLSEIYSTFLTDDAKFQMVLDECPPVVSFHFGLPDAEKITALKDKGIILFSTAITLADAKVAQDAGIDAIVAQGWEAGGHRGIVDPNSQDTRLGTFALTRVLAEKPVCSRDCRWWNNGRRGHSRGVKYGCHMCPDGHRVYRYRSQPRGCFIPFSITFRCGA